MKKIISSLIVIACLLTLGVGSAMAAEYSSIGALLTANYGQHNYREVSPNVLFDYFPNGAAQSMNIKYTKPYVISEDSYTLGIYNPQGLVKTPYFGVGTGTDLDFNNKQEIAPRFSFGLYINYITGSTTKTFYSRTTDNNNVQHAKVYQVMNDNQPIDGKYVVAFDDGDAAHGLNDFMDLVIEIHPVTASIPEFPTIALPVATIMGIMFIVGRRRKE